MRLPWEEPVEPAHRGGRRADAFAKCEDRGLERPQRQGHRRDVAGNTGQIALDPASGALITDTIENETHRVMANLRAVLAEAGLDESRIDTLVETGAVE